MCKIEHLMHNGRVFSKTLFLYIEGNVMINPLPVCLIQNFVAHSRIQLAFHVYITGAPHILHCFCKMIIQGSSEPLTKSTGIFGLVQCQCFTS